MPSMRAKFVLSSVETYHDGNERLKFNAVCKSTAYEGEGLDEDNTFARFSPSASCDIYVANPALHGRFKIGEKFYVDFTPVPVPTPAA